MKCIAINIFILFLGVFFSVFAQAGFDEAMMAVKVGDYRVGLSELTRLANDGDVKSQSQLGFMYLKGLGVAANDQEAIHWLQLAEAQGDARAQNNLANLYLTGRGVAIDLTKALRRLRLSADQGYVLGQLGLASMYGRGLGVTKDAVEAEKWCRLAATQGNPDAQYLLGSMYLNGEALPKDDKEAANWFRKAAEQGHVKAETALGAAYSVGRGVLQDDIEAVKWLQLAANHGDIHAQELLPMAQRYKLASDVVDKGYESKPPPDAPSPSVALSMMHAAKLEAQSIKDGCLKQRADLQPELEMNFSKWTASESHAIALAERHWSSVVDADPEIADITEKLSDAVAGLTLSFIAAPNKDVVLLLFCKKYFSDLASGVWRVA